MPEINDTAPDFELYYEKGKTLSLSSLRGKKVVIAFFPGAFTGVCTKEMCTLQDAIGRFADLNATVVGISVDGLFSNLAFAAQNNVQFPLLTDHDRSTTQAYGVIWEDFAGIEGFSVANRSVFIVDEEGTITYKWVAPNPGVEPDYDEVEAALG